MTKNQTTGQLVQTSGDKKAPTTRYCQCGCGESTSSSKTAYKPGHDARHAGSVARDLAAFWIDGGEGANHSMLDELASPLLRSKAEAMAKRLVQRVAEKSQTAERKLAKKTAKANKPAKSAKVAEVVAAEEAAHAEQSAPPVPEWDEEPVPFSVKVGRWEYPAIKDESGQTLRNTKRDGSGEWVAL